MSGGATANKAGGFLVVSLLLLWAKFHPHITDAFTMYSDTSNRRFGLTQRHRNSNPRYTRPESTSLSKLTAANTRKINKPLAFAQPARRDMSWMQLHAAKKTAASDDDEIDSDEAWEPDDEELMETDEFEDLEVDESDEVDEDQEVVARSENDDDDDDDDDDDLELDPWDEDEEDEEFGVEASVDEEEDDDSQVEYYYEDDDDEPNYPLEDDPDDPDYQAQKMLVEETVKRRDSLAQDKDFDEVDFMINHMTMEESEALDKLPFIQAAKKMEEDLIVVDDNDVKDIDLEKEVSKISDLMDDDPYENKGVSNILGTGVSDDDLEELDNAWKDISKTVKEDPWDKVTAKDLATDWYALDNQTLTEMDACLDEIGGSAYNCTRWLLYDLDFNVSNLLLASVKHNRQAPILFQHWYPQLLTYERYRHARDRNFDFTWDDVENADISELERYYAGFGYSEIPKKAPAETGIISLEDLEEEELRMAAFENWMTEVYNPEVDKKDFDDDDFRDEDNVYSKFYEAPQHPDLPKFEDTQEDLAIWEDEMGENEDDKDYKELYGREFKYAVEKDVEFEKEFRGHLVVACSPDDADLEVAETITARMAKEFGKQIYVETRVMAHAREEDSVFEVWLESYEIDLLHSKRRATLGSKGWEGPAECDARQIDYIVETVRFLISDDARYSYRRELDVAA